MDPIAVAFLAIGAVGLLVLGLQLSGDLTGLDVGALLKRLGSGAAGLGETPSPVTRVSLDGNGADPARS